MLQPAVEMQKKPGKPGFFDLPLCFGRERAPIGALGVGAIPPPLREPLRGPRAPFAQRKKHQIPVANTAQPPSAPPGVFPVPAEGAAQGCAGGAAAFGGRGHRPRPAKWKARAGGQGPRPGRSGRYAPPPPPPGRWDSANPNGTGTSYGM